MFQYSNCQFLEINLTALGYPPSVHIFNPFRTVRVKVMLKFLLPARIFLQALIYLTY